MRGSRSVSPEPWPVDPLADRSPGGLRRGSCTAPCSTSSRHEVRIALAVTCIRGAPGTNCLYEVRQMASSGVASGYVDLTPCRPWFAVAATFSRYPGADCGFKREDTSREIQAERFGPGSQRQGRSFMRHLISCSLAVGLMFCVGNLAQAQKPSRGNDLKKLEGELKELRERAKELEKRIDNARSSDDDEDDDNGARRRTPFAGGRGPATGDRSEMRERFEKMRAGQGGPFGKGAPFGKGPPAGKGPFGKGPFGMGPGGKGGPFAARPFDSKGKSFDGKGPAARGDSKKAESSKRGPPPWAAAWKKGPPPGIARKSGSGRDFSQFSRGPSFGGHGMHGRGMSSGGRGMPGHGMQGRGGHGPGRGMSGHGPGAGWRGGPQGDRRGPPPSRGASSRQRSSSDRDKQLDAVVNKLEELVRELKK